ncbi:MAG: type II secretion system F family protein [Anaerolineae bacterium]|nr:type II secretion system F family protein [Anaerolineae bacterium]
MDTTALDRQLSDGVYVLVTALRAGYSLRQSLEAMAQVAPEPTASLFQGVLADLEAGCTYDDAFAKAQETWPSPHLAQIVETIAQHRQTGGNLADQLAPLAEAIYQAVGSDSAFYPAMRFQAQELGNKLPDRVKKG